MGAAGQAGAAAAQGGLRQFGEAAARSVGSIGIVK
jgi:hypothetical protein